VLRSKTTETIGFCPFCGSNFLGQITRVERERVSGSIWKCYHCGRVFLVGFPRGGETYA